MKIIEISDYRSLSGSAYDVWVPSEFTFTWQNEDKKKSELFELPDKLNDRPLGTEGALFSISDRAQLAEVLEDKGNLVVRVEGNAGRGSWRDAVFLIRQSEGSVWQAKLLLVGKGYRERDRNIHSCHSKYMLREFKNGILTYIRQYFIAGKSYESLEKLRTE